MRRWYIVTDGKERGPFLYRRLREMAITGQITASDGVRRDDAATAIPASKVEGLLPEWHVVSVSKQEGPHPPAALVALASLSQLKGEDLIRRSDRGVWRRADHVAEFIPFVDPVAMVLSRDEIEEVAGKALVLLFEGKEGTVQRGDGELEAVLWSSSAWYVLRACDVRGPIHTDQVKKLVASGDLRPEDLLLHPEYPEWGRVNDLDWFNDEDILVSFDLESTQ